MIQSRHAVRVIRTVLALSTRQTRMIEHSFPRDSAPCTPSCYFETLVKLLPTFIPNVKADVPVILQLNAQKSTCNGIFSFVLL